jgi:ketosteroid isomerase-like protein
MKKTRLPLWWFPPLMLLLFGCQPSAQPPPMAGPDTSSTAHEHVALLMAYEDAFNNEDVDGMLALAHDEIEWISIGDSELSIETTGKEELAESMASYFESVDTRATVEGTMVNGRFVSFVERVRFNTRSGEEKTQASSAIAEIVDGKIRRLSYYPAQP